MSFAKLFFIGLLPGAVAVLGAGCSSSSSAASVEPCNHTLRAHPHLPGAAGQAQELDLGALGYCPEDSVRVSFDGVELAAVSAMPLRVGVPVWISADGRTGASDVDVTIAGPDGSHPLGTLHLNALPVSDRPPGVRARGVLGAITQAIINARVQITAFKNAAEVDAILLQVLADLGALDRALVNATETPEPLFRIGAQNVFLDRAGLEILDGIYLSWLTTELPSGEITTKANPMATPVSLIDDGWFDDMVTEVSRGGLDRVSHFASAASSTLAVLGLSAALLGAAPALTSLAVLGAVAFAATTFAPAATALLISIGARTVAPTDPLDIEVWKTIQPVGRYIFAQSISVAMSEYVAANFQASGPVGDELIRVIDSSFDFSSGIAQRASALLWGVNAACANGAIPREIGFNPDYTLCAKTVRAPVTTGGTCRAVSGGGIAGSQCSSEAEKNEVTCYPPSVPGDCTKSGEYDLNGGILCCEQAR